MQRSHGLHTDIFQLCLNSGYSIDSSGISKKVEIHHDILTVDEFEFLARQFYFSAQFLFCRYHKVVFGFSSICHSVSDKLGKTDITSSYTECWLL